MSFANEKAHQCCTLMRQQAQNASDLLGRFKINAFHVNYDSDASSSLIMQMRVIIQGTMGAKVNEAKRPIIMTMAYLCIWDTEFVFRGVKRGNRRQRDLAS